jgi:hypothetical protein
MQRVTHEVERGEDPAGQRDVAQLALDTRGPPAPRPALGGRHAEGGVRASWARRAGADETCAR